MANVDPIVQLRKAVITNDLTAVKQLIAQRRIDLSTDDLDSLLSQLPPASFESLLQLKWPQPLEFLSPGRLLCIAAERGDVSGVDNLLYTEELVASAFATAALLAAQNDHPVLATKLFERSCNTKHWDYGKALPFLYEAWISLLPRAKEAAASVLQTHTAIDKQLRTAFLHFAARTPDSDRLEYLLENADVPSIIDASLIGDYYGASALQRACFYGNFKAVDLLLKNGAKPDHKDRRGRSALHFAAESGNQLFMEKLLPCCLVELLNLTDHEGMTPLHVAASEGHTGVMETLLNNGANAELKSKGYGAETSFDLLLASYLPIRRELKEDFCTIQDACFRLSPIKSAFWTPGGFTALHFAVLYGGKETTKALLNLAPHLVEVKDMEGLTAYDWAEAAGWGKEFETYCKDMVGLKFEVLKECSFSKHKAKALLEIAKRGEERKDVVAWVDQMGCALKSSEWVLAHMLAAHPTQMNFTLDRPAWDHLVWALKTDPLTTALWEAEKRPCASHQRHVRNNRVQAVLLKLMTGANDSKDDDDDDSKKKRTTSNAIVDKAVLQSCLMWAMERHMVDLAIHLAHDRDCDLMEVTQGCKFTETPLQYAASWWRMPWGEWGLRPVLQVMEQRKDVRSTMYEDRSLYVDYLNSLLVASVLIAGLAFSSWLQPPLGAAPFQLSNYNVNLFVWFNQLGFFLSMAATIACISGAIPIPAGQLAYTKLKIHNAIAIATILIVSSVICVSIAFNCAAFALIPPNTHEALRKNLKMVSAIIGGSGSLILVLLVYRLIQLWDPIHYILVNLAHSEPSKKVGWRYGVAITIVLFIKFYLKYFHNIFVPTQYRSRWRERLGDIADKVYGGETHTLLSK